MSAGKGALPSSAIIGEVVKAVESTDIQMLSLRWGETGIRVVQSAEPARAGTFHTAPPVVEVGIAINAPLTGVYYARPAPEQPPFVELGGHVSKGQVVGLIETMKLFNEIVSELEGSVSEILASEGDLVEANKPLMRVIPSDDGSQE